MQVPKFWHLWTSACIQKNPFLSKRVYKAALWGVKTGYEDDKKTMLGKHVFNPGAAPYIGMIGMIIVFFSGCNR